MGDHPALVPGQNPEAFYSTEISFPKHCRSNIPVLTSGVTLNEDGSFPWKTLYVFKAEKKVSPTPGLLCPSLKAPVNSFSSVMVTEESSEMINSEGALETTCSTLFVLNSKKHWLKK